MKNAQGDSFVELSDIIKDIGRPAGICDYVLEAITHNEFNIDDFSTRLIIDTSRDGNFAYARTLQNLKLIFIPVELVEQYIICRPIIIAMVTAARVSSTLKSEEAANRIRNSYETRFEDDDAAWSEKNITNHSCIMIVYDNQVLQNVYTASPAKVIATLTQNL